MTPEQLATMTATELDTVILGSEVVHLTEDKRDYLRELGAAAQDALDNVTGTGTMRGTLRAVRANDDHAVDLLRINARVDQGLFEAAARGIKRGAYRTVVYRKGV